MLWQRLSTPISPTQKGTQPPPQEMTKVDFTTDSQSHITGPLWNFVSISEVDGKEQVAPRAAGRSLLKQGLWLQQKWLGKVYKGASVHRPPSFPMEGEDLWQTAPWQGKPRTRFSVVRSRYEGRPRRTFMGSANIIDKRGHHLSLSALDLVRPGYWGSVVVGVNSDIRVKDLEPESQQWKWSEKSIRALQWCFQGMDFWCYCLYLALFPPLLLNFAYILGSFLLLW